MQNHQGAVRLKRPFWPAAIAKCRVLLASFASIVDGFRAVTGAHIFRARTGQWVVSNKKHALLLGLVGVSE